jgi:hypothetical protein
MGVDLQPSKSDVKKGGLDLKSKHLLWAVLPICDYFLMSGYLSRVATTNHRYWCWQWPPLSPPSRDSQRLVDVGECTGQ